MFDYSQRKPTKEWYKNWDRIFNHDYTKIKRSPDCCGCASFPYALCGDCYDYNFNKKEGKNGPESKERRQGTGADKQG